jgi:dinuclear metal center YbgI/SA1388 family protein
MKIKDVAGHIESIAPLALQESYDNAGLIIGNGETEVSGIMLCLDSTEEVIAEAIDKGCNLIVAHHPIVFSGLKKLNGKNYVERAVMLAVKNDVAIYAAHTNLDNVLKQGVNEAIANRLGLQDLRILQPKEGQLNKLVTFCPHEHADKVRQAIFDAGAGHIGNYDECSFNLEGTGTFRAGEGADPFVGEIGKLQKENEIRIETVFPFYMRDRVLKAMIKAHPYEEVAYDVYALATSHSGTGAGVIGNLPHPMESSRFLEHLKEKMDLECIRYTDTDKIAVQKIAVCGGAGSFLLRNALSAGADVLVTADFKYHEFFDAEKKLMIADVGHYESEFYTIRLFGQIISKLLPNIAVVFTSVNTNPIKYFY